MLWTLAEWDVLVGPSHVASQGLGILIFEMGVLIELWGVYGWTGKLLYGRINRVWSLTPHLWPFVCLLKPSKDVTFLQVLMETHFAAWSSSPDWLSRPSSVILHGRDTVFVCV